LGSILAGDRGQSAFCITASRGNVVGDIRMCAEVSNNMSISTIFAYRNLHFIV
jgi:hypothetical protein